MYAPKPGCCVRPAPAEQRSGSRLPDQVSSVRILSGSNWEIRGELFTDVRAAEPQQGRLRGVRLGARHVVTELGDLLFVGCQLVCRTDAKPADEGAVDLNVVWDPVPVVVEIVG